MSSIETKNVFIETIKWILGIFYFEIAVRLFTLPTLVIMISWYLFVLDANFGILGTPDDNWNILGQSWNYVLGDSDFYDDDLPYLLFLLVTLVGVIESTIYRVFYAHKISFPRFLYSYKSLLILFSPIWLLTVSIIGLQPAGYFFVVPFLLIFPYLFTYALLNAEYAMYVIADRLLPYHKIREKKINQKAIPPWKATKYIGVNLDNLFSRKDQNRLVVEWKYRVESFEKINEKIVELNISEPEKENSKHYYAQTGSNDVIKIVEKPTKTEIHFLVEDDGQFRLSKKMAMKSLNDAKQFVTEKKYELEPPVMMKSTTYNFKDGKIGLYTINDKIKSIILTYPPKRQKYLANIFGLKQADRIRVPFNKLV